MIRGLPTSSHTARVLLPGSFRKTSPKSNLLNCMMPVPPTSESTLEVGLVLGCGDFEHQADMSGCPTATLDLRLNLVEDWKK
jgi:hypothetical protein